MAALVQTLPPQSFTMLQNRPSSSGGYIPTQVNNQKPRYNTQSNTGYRGVPSSGPVAPYAFTSTPSLNNTTSANMTARSLIPRPVSTSMLPQIQPPQPVQAKSHNQQPSTSSPLSLSVSMDFGSSPSFDLSMPSSIPKATVSPSGVVKPSPDRYRRNVQRADSSESGPNRGQSSIYSNPSQSTSSPSLTASSTYRASIYSPASSYKGHVDDTVNSRRQPADLASRYRRRSVGTIDPAAVNGSGEVDVSASGTNSLLQPQVYQSYHAGSQRPTSHAHTGSSESVVSSKSARSSSRPSSTRTDSFNSQVTTAASAHAIQATKHDVRVVNVPARVSDPTRRNPSPLSKPADMNGERSPQVKSQTRLPAPAPSPVSPAAEHLAALNEKNAKKPKSKLRRAFSFGSAAELRKATAQANLEKNVAAQTTAKRNSKFEDEMEPEQARIAEKQEAAGLGESIYSGQGHFFTGSTDNLSISSTASSASLMLRKMGKGMKKGTRSLVGLFRPKSVIGVPAADGPVNEASAAAVSMVTVEAERERVNVNLNPHDQAGGGTGFPKLERNSIDMKDTKVSLDSYGTVSSDSRSRRSIVGGEKERAEILAAVKKGILKRTDSGQASPRMKFMDQKTGDLNLPQMPHLTESPRSSAPSTPRDEPPRSGHRRTDSITIEDAENDDYFTSIARFASADSKNVPMTPTGGMRNISFSPRIQFHDTWPSGEYDRRGEIATCNRLTPMLAQQIKEELNTFKMEMEVHESSKVYTHFF